MRDAAGFENLGDELPPLFLGAHGGAAVGRPPNRRDHRADDESPGADFIRQGLDLVVGGVDVDVRLEEEQVHAIELHAIDGGLGGQGEHRVQIDGRLGIGTFADEAGPHGIVQFGQLVHGCSSGFGMVKLPVAWRCLPDGSGRARSFSASAAGSKRKPPWSPRDAAGAISA